MSNINPSEVEGTSTVVEKIEKIRRRVRESNEYETYMLFVKLGKDLPEQEQAGYLAAFQKMLEEARN